MKTIPSSKYSMCPQKPITIIKLESPLLAISLKNQESYVEWVTTVTVTLGFSYGYPGWCYYF